MREVRFFLSLGCFWAVKLVDRAAINLILGMNKSFSVLYIIRAIRDLYRSLKKFYRVPAVLIFSEFSVTRFFSAALVFNFMMSEKFQKIYSEIEIF